MEISYKREMKHNYLVIEGESTDNSYEVRMMADNVIEGLMKFRVKRVDNQYCYCYEITSGQPFSRLLKDRCLKVEEVRILILGMAKILGKLEEYLLREEQMLLQPEYIYVEPERFSVEFCLIPGRMSDFPAELGKLLEYLLGKMDYQDKACVVMTYGIYRESLKENCGIEDLLKFLTGMAGQETEEERENQPGYQSEYQSEYSSKYQSKYQPEPSPVIPSIRSVKPTKPVKPINPLEPPEGKIKKLSWKEWLKQKFYQLRGEKNEKIQQKTITSQETELPWQMVFVDEQVHAPVPQDTESSQTPGKYEGPEGANTVPLYDKEKKQLRWLISLESGIPDIIVAYYPFIIGKQESLVNFVMAQDTVSRLRLWIDEKDGIYQITDLNSTNGTGVAGGILENNESTEVHPGSKVTVAGVRFKFG